MRTWCGYLLTLAVLCSASQSTGQKPLRIAVLPFEDRAGFQGKWTLATDVPALLGQFLSAAATVQIVSPDTIAAVAERRGLEERGSIKSIAQLGEQVGADVAVVGLVESFGTRRLTAGDPNLIGYKAYTSRIALSDVRLVRVATGREVDVLDISRESQERPLGLDLFGRPRQQDREFRELFEVEFASERFFDLQLGKLASEVFEELSRQIIRTLVDRPAIDLSGDLAKVLSVEAEEVFLGLGVVDQVERGDRLPIFDDGGKPVALVEVVDVLGSHLCKARLVEQSGQIEVGYKPGQRVPDIELNTPGEKE